MKIIDISWPLEKSITEYKDRALYKFNFWADFTKINMRESIITIDSHTGTHVDAPAHFIKDGKNIDQIDLQKLIGQALVLDLSNVIDKITRLDLEEAIKKAELKEKDLKDLIILLKTKNSDLEDTAKFDYNFIYLEKSGAQYLRDLNVKAIGIDYIGIERNQPEHDTHKILLGSNMPLIEGLRLKSAEPKKYMLICLPLKFIGLEAGLARAILIEDY